jgi:hypothetical protein
VPSIARSDAEDMLESQAFSLDPCLVSPTIQLSTVRSQLLYIEKLVKSLPLQRCPSLARVTSDRYSVAGLAQHEHFGQRAIRFHVDYS